ncbi:ubiquinone biosynthesis O-methyltransferase, mitochondrial isoform X2 [Capsicum annuum]|uniref:ubiquinone biosynthesis O-methyltransferase, mitochondrial isoform X2 n=1 Tax=Capsicum annuum TaxID=4072 RepID=UPI001FB06BDB|nr:ubiquinone biosynthesis O-methyltransferase, mitochondrial isoform X2 [Capsicum annuum]
MNFVPMTQFRPNFMNAATHNFHVTQHKFSVSDSLHVFTIFSSGMASKLLHNRLRSLCRVSQLSNIRYSNSIFSTSQNHAQCRFYSEASQQTPLNPPPPPSPNNTSNTTSSTSSLNEFELAKFSSIAETWWDAEGPFKPLHLMNPTRLAFIRFTLCRHFRKDPNCTRPFEGLKFIDVGCGGGILSEPLARMGATVTGVDAVDKNIKIARLHADLDPQTSSIEYRCTTAESLVEEQRQFDAVIALEVIEHVADPAEFCKSLSALTIPGGATVISTINRSMRAYATAIVAAEYILHWLDFTASQRDTSMVKLSNPRRTSSHSSASFYNCARAGWICVQPFDGSLVLV